MKPPSPQHHPDFHIRATPGLGTGRGKEAPNLTFSATDKANLRRISELIEYKTPGSLVVTEGQAANFVFLLVDGIIEASRTLRDGQKQILAFYWPGDLFGLAERGAYLNSDKAVTPCTVFRFPAERLERFLLENPKVQHAFLVKAVHDLRGVQRNLIVMGRLDIPRRLAAFLLDCSSHERYFDGHDQVLILPFTRYDIADYLGASAESITRAFSRLEKLGLTHRLSARTLQLQTEALRAFADLD